MTGPWHRLSSSRTCLTPGALWARPPDTLPGSFLPRTSEIPKAGQSHLSSKLWPGCLCSGNQMWKHADFILKWRFSWLLICWANRSAGRRGAAASASTQGSLIHFFLLEVSWLSVSTCFLVTLISASLRTARINGFSFTLSRNRDP